MSQPDAFGMAANHYIAATTSCSSWACWSVQQKVGTTLAIVAFVIAILGLIIWGFCCQMKYRNERNGGIEAGDERGGWPRAATPGVVGLYELQMLSDRRRTSRDGRIRNERQREMSPDRSYWSSSSSEREPRRPRTARLAGAFRGLGQGATPRTSSMLPELGGDISSS